MCVYVCIKGCTDEFQCIDDHRSVFAHAEERTKPDANVDGGISHKTSEACND